MRINRDPGKIEEVLTRGVKEILPSKKELFLLMRKKRIRVYQGFDPSMPNLHLGNLVGILKLKQFQDLGHEVIFLIGDFTGRIGDPTGRISARKKLTKKEIIKNIKNWHEQVARFLNFSRENPAKILFNSQWLDKIRFGDLIEISSNFTVQRMLERDFFQERIKKEKPIFLHEFLYPIAQGLDSVFLNIDLEIGGADQLFNMLVGRELMKVLKKKEKFILTTKLLVSKEGEKIGKTTGNAVFLNFSPEDMFGKIMSFPDETIPLGLELLTFLPSSQVEKYRELLRRKKINPKEVKKVLAFEIVKLNYGLEKAKKAEEEFERVFKEKKLPSKIPVIKIKKRTMNILDLLLETKLVQSKSEGKRLILQKGVKIDGKIKSDWKEWIDVKKGMVVNVGKRKFVRLI